MNPDLKTPILVVDDHKMMVDLILGVVRALGYEHVDHALDGQTALAMLQRTAYGLVICDLKMEPMDGFQLLRAMRAKPDLRRIPFLLTTADRQVPNVLAAKQLGVDGYLLKPFTASQLRAKLEALPLRSVEPAA